MRNAVPDFSGVNRASRPLIRASGPLITYGWRETPRSRGVSGHAIAALFVALFLALLLSSPAAQAAEPPAAQSAIGDAADEAATAWRLLDYISIDYAAAVANGKVVNATEYAEQQEFAATARAKIAALPERPARAAILAELAKLDTLIAGKAAPDAVAEAARGTAQALLAAYPVPLAPAAAPSLETGRTLYQQNCAMCHGKDGDGAGPGAAGLDPEPTAFRDATRARERSVFALYQVITQGLDGTAMQSYRSLPDEDRWALAFYVGHFAFADEAAQGERFWNDDPKARGAIPSLTALVSTSPAALAKSVGAQNADALMGYLRQNPGALDGQPVTSHLAFVRTQMAASLAASRAGDTRTAAKLALSAYLDGFELIEPTLGARDGALMHRIESAMLAYRAAVGKEGADALAARQQEILPLLDAAEDALQPGAGNAVSTFVGAATILLREGLEALLIVVAMIAFLKKAERREALPYVHGGWVSALAAGLLTWAAATWMIRISGASRELTEGVGGIVAALVLLSVGIWMHGKAHASEWQRYIQTKMSKALSGRSQWLLFALAFIVVYREAFETILFFAALAAQGSHLAMLAGVLTASVALVAIGWALLRYSNKLPIGTFFRASSWLMAVLTVVLAGKGVAALQEAGMVGITLLPGAPRLSLIGVFPTLETMLAQAAMIVALALGFWWNNARARHHVS